MDPFYSSVTSFTRYIKLTAFSSVSAANDAEVWINTNRVIAIYENAYGSKIHLMDLTEGKPTIIHVLENPRTIVESICSKDK